MISTYSDNAILAKVRALYGKRLTERDYSQLLQKKSVGEVAAYLKKETYYAENLQEVKEELIHREQLENFVQRRTLNTYLRLMKYAWGEPLFLSLYVMQNEIQQLITAIRLLNAGSIDRYIISLPVHLAKLMCFDLFRVAGVRTYDDLLAIVEHSEYYRIIGRFRPTTSHKPIDITAVEAALLAHYYQKALAITAARYSGDTRDELERLLHFQINVHNLSVIYRMRRYLRSSTELIRARLVLPDGKADTRLYDRLLSAPTLPDLYGQLSGLLRMRGYNIAWGGSSKDQVCELIRIRQRMSRRVFRFSPRPVVAVISYMTLLEIEINNIVNIIEGIRYELPPGELKGLLAI